MLICASAVKPIKRDLGRATKLVETCEAAGVPLGIVLQHRFRAGAEALTEAVESGRAGRLHSARVTLPWWRDQSHCDRPGRGTYAADGGGVKLTQAIHVLDLMLSVTGPVTEVVAMTSTTPFHQMEAENFATAGPRFANGAVGSVVATTLVFPGDAESLMLDCDHAALRLTAGELVIHWPDGRTANSGGGSDSMDFPSDWHRDLIADFADARPNGHAPRNAGREALRVHRLIDAIERSARSGQETKLEFET